MQKRTGIQQAKFQQTVDFANVSRLRLPEILDKDFIRELTEFVSDKASQCPVGREYDDMVEDYMRDLISHRYNYDRDRISIDARSIGRFFRPSISVKFNRWSTAICILLE